MSIALLPAESKKQMLLVIAEVTPKKRDTTIADMNKALLTQGLKLKSASGDYIKENGAPFHLFQEYRCSLVVHVNLLDHNSCDTNARA